MHLSSMAVPNVPTAAADKQDITQNEQPAVEVIATLVPWADKEERVCVFPSLLFATTFPHRTP